VNGEYYIMKHVIGIEKSKKPWWLGNVNWYGETRNVCRFLMGKPLQDQPLGNHRWRRITLSWTLIE
jgi:hypothetical protein